DSVAFAACNYIAFRSRCRPETGVEPQTGFGGPGVLDRAKSAGRRRACQGRSHWRRWPIGQPLQGTTTGRRARRPRVRRTDALPAKSPGIPLATPINPLSLTGGIHHQAVSSLAGTISVGGARKKGPSNEE